MAAGGELSADLAVTFRTAAEAMAEWASGGCVRPAAVRAHTAWTRSPRRDVIGAQAPLGEQLLHVAIREYAEIPTHGQENHLRFKLSPLE
jgi:hypothetical protein